MLLQLKETKTGEMKGYVFLIPDLFIKVLVVAFMRLLRFVPRQPAAVDYYHFALISNVCRKMIDHK